MAVFNFKTTEDSTPGGGVYKIGTGTSITIRQSDYPDVNLASLTANNFFKRTECGASETGSVYNNEYYCNIYNEYGGGSTSISYSYSGGVGTVTVNETQRWCRVNKYLGEEGTSGKKYGSYTHTVYMSKNALL